jgi:hypothetical protein
VTAVTQDLAGKSRTVSVLLDAWRMVAGTETEALKSVSFADLGWAGATAKGRDLWEHADVGPFTAAIPARSVEPHQTVLLRLFKQ